MDLIKISGDSSFGYGISEKNILMSQNMKNPKDIFEMSKKYDFDKEKKNPFFKNN